MKKALIIFAIAALMGTSATLAFNQGGAEEEAACCKAMAEKPEKPACCKAKAAAAADKTAPMEGCDEPCKKGAEAEATQPSAAGKKASCDKPCHGKADTES